MPTKSFDVAVVGAGVFGAWTAYHVRQTGRSVLLIDAYGPAHARASSGGESRIIRMGYGPDEIYTRMSMRSLALWQALFAAERAPLPLFHQTGVLWIARADDAYTTATQATLDRVGVAVEALGHDDLARRFPHMTLDEDVRALYEPESGVLMARRGVQTVVEAARRSGVDVRIGAVDAPRPAPGASRVTSIATRSGDVFGCDLAIFACGPWLPKVFPDLLADRIVPARQDVFFWGVPAGSSIFGPTTTPAWIDFGAEIYGVPDLEGRGIKIACDRHGDPIDPDTLDRRPSESMLQEVRARMERRFPALAGAPLVESRVCQYENTSNGDFLIDAHPSFDNVWLVGGGSGHGFKHGPAVGEYVTRRIVANEAGDPRFSLATKEATRRRTVY